MTATGEQTGGRRRAKVFVSAYSCEPGAGSEPGVGWNWVLQVARFHDVWVLTRRNNRPAIEAALRGRPSANPRWVYFDLPSRVRFWKKGQRGVHLYYILWQLGAYMVARRLNRRERFDLVHHVTFVNYWLGTLLPLLSMPCVWGPVGGGESCPAAFYRSFGLRGRLYELARSAARWLGEHNPVLRIAAGRVAVALATTNDTGRRLRELGCRRVRVLSEAGMDGSEIGSLGRLATRRDGVFHLVSIGRLLHWKGFHLGLAAFAMLHEKHAGSRYSLIGDGPERDRLERLAEKLGVADSVSFLGAIPRKEVLDRLGTSGVLVHPSLHDSGGWVCLEAMTAGRPVICLDLGGPATQVTAETGFVIPASNPGRAVEDMAQALLRLALDPELGRRLGDAGRRRVAERFAWDRKGQQMDGIYRDCLG